MDIIKKYVEQFNETDNELYRNNINNSHAYEWMKEEIPVFECPDKDIERTYYFRWWTFRKHIKNTPDGYVVTEFLPDVPWGGRHNVIIAAVGHHLAEGRWLKNSHKYLDSYIRLILSGDKDVKAHQYSSWFVYAVLDFFKAAGMSDNLTEILNASCKYHKIWEKEHGLPNGMFWSLDLPDAMEFSISGRNGLTETKGIRPTLNSYMYADRYAISQLAMLLGNSELAEEYMQKAESLRTLINDNLWSCGFYRAFHYENGNANSAFDRDGTKIARELIGYIPWMFNIPPQGRNEVFDLLTDHEVFYAPQGLTTADQKEERFLYEAEHECLWNGYVWPFATSQTLTALINVIRNYHVEKYKDTFFKLLRQYAQSHTIIDESGRILPWIDEVKHPYRNEWTSRTWLAEHNYPSSKGPIERGKDYNHSTFCDLVITGLAGVCCDKGELTAEPIIPDDWEYFTLSNLWFKGECYTVTYDKTGNKYNHGKGLTIKKKNK